LLLGGADKKLGTCCKTSTSQLRICCGQCHFTVTRILIIDCLTSSPIWRYAAILKLSGNAKGGALLVSLASTIIDAPCLLTNLWALLKRCCCGYCDGRPCRFSQRQIDNRRFRVHSRNIPILVSNQCLSLRLLSLHLYYSPSFALFSLLFSSTVSSRFVAETLRNTRLIQLDCESSLAHVRTVTVKSPSKWLTLNAGRKGVVVARMSHNPPQRDYFSINTTKIYSANPSGNFTVTSLPLTRRHLQDIESPSHYNLLFDLIANKFSRTPLYRRSLETNPAPLETTAIPGGHHRPTFSATRSAEAVLTPQRREHQQGRGCTKFASACTRTPDSPTINQDQLHNPVPIQQRPPFLTAKSVDTFFTRQGRGRPRNSPDESPSRIAAISVGALLTLPEHTQHEIPPDEPYQPHQSYQPSPSSARSAGAGLPRHKPVTGSLHRLHVNTTKSADPILAPRQAAGYSATYTELHSPQRLSNINMNSTTSLPASAMSPNHAPHPGHHSPDPFTAIGNPHQNTSLFPQKEGILSIRNAKKAARVRAAEQKAEQKQKERADKAATKIARANAEAAKRAEREQRESAEKMKKLEKEAEKQRLRREEQVINMEKKRRREEEKERVMEVRRHKRALGGMSWGFDPGAGTRASRDSHSAGSGGVGSATGESAHSAELHETGFHRMRRGTTWGITGGGPGRVAGYDGDGDDDDVHRA
jgi:hypothetical protein